MLSDRMRARLAQLNRAPLPPSGQRKPAQRRVDASPPDADGLSGTVAKTEISSSLTSVQDGHEIETPVGKHWLIQRPVVSLWPNFAKLQAEAEQSFTRQEDPADVRAEWKQFRRQFPTNASFLDLETCGFAGSMVFLAGVIHCVDDTVVLSQMLARNYAEEPAMLWSLWDTMADGNVLVTFNGKSFDWPMVQDRSTLHRLAKHRPLASPSTHVDLLHDARRRYRRELPNCRLQTLEWYLCGRRRVGDIPGSEIPDVYHHYVRTGDDTELRGVLHHNALDLVTLLQLALRFAT